MTTRSVEHEMLIPAAIREQVRQAGHHPDTKSGERLVDWAKAQVGDGGRVPSVRELAEKSAEWGLAVETPPVDPATIEQQIAEAREAGDFERASALEYEVDRVRARAQEGTPTDDELAAIDAARQRAQEATEEADAAETEDAARDARERARAAWEEASSLQLQAERRMRGTDQPPEYPPEYQPTGGLSTEQHRLLEDEGTPLADRLRAAQEAGDYTVASILESRLERERATA